MPVVQSSFATAPVSRPVQRAAVFDNVHSHEIGANLRTTHLVARSKSSRRPVDAEDGAGHAHSRIATARLVGYAVVVGDSCVVRLESLTYTRGHGQCCTRRRSRCLPRNITD